MPGKVRCGLFLYLLFFTASGLTAESSGLEKIISEVKVYSWNAAKRVWYEGRTVKRITIIYDRRGRPTGETLTDGADELLERITYRHEGGTCIRSVFGPDGALRRTVVTERTGDTETETIVLPDGSVHSRHEKRYDRSDRLTEIRRQGPDGRLVFTKVYEYDDRGDPSRIFVLNHDGVQAFVIEYRYLSYHPTGEWKTRAEYYTYGDVRRRPHEIVYRTFIPWKDD